MLALDQSITKMRKTQSRVRAQLAVHDANAALQRAGDMWAEGGGGGAAAAAAAAPRSPTGANAGAAARSAAWSMLDELEAERARLEAEIARPVPFQSGPGKGKGGRG